MMNDGYDYLVIRSSRLELDITAPPANHCGTDSGNKLMSSAQDGSAHNWDILDMTTDLDIYTQSGNTMKEN